jgi:hypothetical protein
LVWLRLHRWLGLGLGAVFVLFGLTGSLLVFYVGIDEAIEPAQAVPEPAPQVRSWQGVLEVLQRSHPQRDRGWRIELPPGGRGLVTARYLKPSEAAGAFYKPLLVTVNPATEQVLANRLWGNFAATWVYDLHYMLLAGETGHTVVGLLGLLMLLCAGGWAGAVVASARALGRRAAPEAVGQSPAPPLRPAQAGRRDVEAPCCWYWPPPALRLRCPAGWSRRWRASVAPLPTPAPQGYAASRGAAADAGPGSVWRPRALARVRTSLGGHATGQRSDRSRSAVAAWRPQRALPAQLPLDSRADRRGAGRA